MTSSPAAPEAVGPEAVGPRTVGAAATAVGPAVRRAGARLFAGPADEPRARRASDGIALVAATVALAATSAAAVPPAGASQALGRYLTSLPDVVDGLWQLLADGVVLLAVLVVVGAVVRRRTAVTRDLVLATVVAVAVWLAVGRAVEGAWTVGWEPIRSAAPPAWYPSLRVALPGAVLLTAFPHLALPLRRLGRWALAAAMVALAALGAATPLGVLGGLLVAVIAAAAVHLALGSSSGRPGLGLVRAALDQLGVATGTLGAADRQHAGLFVVHATDAGGRPLIVKVYGRDAHDTALVSALWRTVWYRDAGTPLRIGRLQQVEHEAFLTLLAGQAGIPTDTVVTAGATAEDDALLVLRRAGRTLDAAPDGLDGDALVAPLWALVARLHDGLIAHGQLDEQHLLLTDDGRLGVVDLRGALVAAGDVQRRVDEVQAFVTTVGLVGRDRAVAAALDALGPDGVARMLPFLQPSVLTAHQRRAGLAGGAGLDELRADAARAAGTEPPDLQELRRVSPGSIAQVLLPAVAVVSLFLGLTGLDLEQLGGLVREASWWLVALGVALTQLPRLTQAISTLGASPIPLPLGPVYALQLAVSYLNIAIPTSAARIAVNIRFFQRHGVPPGAAFAAGAVDGACGFLVQAAVLTTLLVFTPASLDLRLGDAAGGAGPILLVAAVIAVASVVVALAMGRVRRFVASWVRRLAAEAATTLRGLRSPRRLAMLFGGNLATEVLFAAGLGAFTRALGYPVGLDELLVVNISVALLAGLLPVPGGIGVAEGGLTFGLVQAGVPEEVALAAALLQRLSSFYLPPIWGFFALRWLERHDHL